MAPNTGGRNTNPRSRPPKKRTFAAALSSDTDSTGSSSSSSSSGSSGSNSSSSGDDSDGFFLSSCSSAEKASMHRNARGATGGTQKTLSPHRPSSPMLLATQQTSTMLLAPIPRKKKENPPEQPPPQMAEAIKEPPSKLQLSRNGDNVNASNNASNHQENEARRTSPRNRRKQPTTTKKTTKPSTPARTRKTNVVVLLDTDDDDDDDDFTEEHEEDFVPSKTKKKTASTAEAKPELGSKTPKCSLSENDPPSGTAKRSAKAVPPKSLDQEDNTNDASKNKTNKRRPSRQGTDSLASTTLQGGDTRTRATENVVSTGTKSSILEEEMARMAKDKDAQCKKDLSDDVPIESPGSSTAATENGNVTVPKRRRIDKEVGKEAISQSAIRTSTAAIQPPVSKVDTDTKATNSKKRRSKSSEDTAAVDAPNIMPRVQPSRKKRSVDASPLQMDAANEKESAPPLSTVAPLASDVQAAEVNQTDARIKQKSAAKKSIVDKGADTRDESAPSTDVAVPDKDANLRAGQKSSMPNSAVLSNEPQSSTADGKESNNIINESGSKRSQNNSNGVLVEKVKETIPPVAAPATTKSTPIEKPKVKKLTFQDQVFQHMMLAYKPFSLKTLAGELKTTESALNYLMLSLVDKKAVIKKEFVATKKNGSSGPTKELYWVNYDTNAKEMRSCLATAEERAASQQEHKALMEEASGIDGILSNLLQGPSNEELTEQLANEEVLLQSMRERLKDLKDRIGKAQQKLSSSKVSTTGGVKAERHLCPRRMKIRINHMRDEWRKRREKCVDFVEQLADGMEKKPKDVIKLLELETDEIVGVTMPPKHVIES